MHDWHMWVPIDDDFDLQLFLNLLEKGYLIYNWNCDNGPLSESELRKFDADTSTGLHSNPPYFANMKPGERVWLTLPGRTLPNGNHYFAEVTGEAHLIEDLPEDILEQALRRASGNHCDGGEHLGRH